MAKSKKVKDTGRPAGAPNKKSGYVRNDAISARVSEGCKKTIAHLVEVGGYKSPADVLHDAVQLLALKKLTKPGHLYWVNKIQ